MDQVNHVVETGKAHSQGDNDPLSDTGICHTIVGAYFQLQEEKNCQPFHLHCQMHLMHIVTLNEVMHKRKWMILD